MTTRGRTVHSFVVTRLPPTEQKPVPKLFEVLFRERIVAQATTEPRGAVIPKDLTVTDPQFLRGARFQPTSSSSSQQQQPNVDHATTTTTTTTTATVRSSGTSNRTSDSDSAGDENDIDCVAFHCEGSVMMKDGCADSEGSVVVAIMPNHEDPSPSNDKTLANKAVQLGSAPFILLKFSSDQAALSFTGGDRSLLRSAFIMNADKLVKCSYDNPARSLKV
ncbi:hypothetical protein Pelo_18803 [Pelomyxa schiedti]|nr:hypothetical protein Pelo_18803 [Pelomyxa schiedti]